MDVTWIKISGWPNSYSERMDVLTSSVSNLTIIRAKRLNGTDINTEWNIIEVLPGRHAYLKPRIKVFLYPFWVLFGGIAAAYHIRRNHSDIIHAANFPFDALSGTIAKLLTDVPLVVSVRGLQLPRYSANRDPITRIKNRIARTILYGVNKLSLAYADGIVTKAEYQPSYLKETYGINVPTVSIPTGVDFEEFDPDKHTDESILTEFIDDNFDHVLLHLGKLVPGKGVDMLIENLPAVEDDSIGLLLVGDFQNDSFESHLRKRIEENELEERVIIHKGKIPFVSVPRLLKDVDVVCLLSRPAVEGIPRVLQEAVVMETPIIGADVDGIKGVFNGVEGCYMIDANDAEQFSEAVDTALENSPNRDHFVDELNMVCNYAKYAEFYNYIAD